MTIQINPASIWDVWNYLVNTGIDGLEIRASEAIDIFPSTGNAQVVKTTIENQIQQYDWIITRCTSTYLLIEPRYTSKSFFEPGDTIYHVTKKSNRKNIELKGLEPGTGGRTRMNRSYPERIFFAMDVQAAFQFVDFQAGCRTQNFGFNGDGSVTTSAGGPTVVPEEQDIFCVAVPSGITFYKDVLFPGKAVWCEFPIVPSHLARLTFWPARRGAINWIARQHWKKS